jgi:hypothetical protein
MSTARRLWRPAVDVLGSVPAASKTFLCHADSRCRRQGDCCHVAVRRLDAMVKTGGTFAASGSGQDIEPRMGLCIQTVISRHAGRGVGRSGIIPRICMLSMESTTAGTAPPFKGRYFVSANVIDTSVRPPSPQGSASHTLSGGLGQRLGRLDDGLLCGFGCSGPRFRHKPTLRQWLMADQGHQQPDPAPTKHTHQTQTSLPSTPTLGQV